MESLNTIVVPVVSIATGIVLHIIALDDHIVRIAQTNEINLHTDRDIVVIRQRRRLNPVILNRDIMSRTSTSITRHKPCGVDHVAILDYDIVAPADPDRLPLFVDVISDVLPSVKIDIMGVPKSNYRSVPQTVIHYITESASKIFTISVPDVDAR